MKKKFNIFGRKVPVLAVVMAVLIIGTASAALIANYATLSGTFEVGETIVVTSDGDTILNGETGTIVFNESGGANFTIANSGDGTTVNLNTTLLLDEGTGPVVVDNTEGITITYEIDTDTEDPYILIGLENQLIPDQVIPIANGDNLVTVTFEGDPALVTGNYTIQVAVNPVIAPE